MVVAGTDSGNPAASTALRPTLRAWAPTCDDAAHDHVLDQRRVEVVALDEGWRAPRRPGRPGASRRAMPLRLPPGVRTTSTITASPIWSSPRAPSAPCSASVGLAAREGPADLGRPLIDVVPVPVVPEGTAEELEQPDGALAPVLRRDHTGELVVVDVAEGLAGLVDRPGVAAGAALDRGAERAVGARRGADRTDAEQPRRPLGQRRLVLAEEPVGVGDPGAVVDGAADDGGVVPAERGHVGHRPHVDVGPGGGERLGEARGDLGGRAVGTGMGDEDAQQELQEVSGPGEASEGPVDTGRGATSILRTGGGSARWDVPIHHQFGDSGGACLDPPLAQRTPEGGFSASGSSRG